MRTFDQMPSASRNVSRPDSLEMPAPVKITIEGDRVMTPSYSETAGVDNRTTPPPSRRKAGKGVKPVQHRLAGGCVRGVGIGFGRRVPGPARRYRRLVAAAHL